MDLSFLTQFINDSTVARYTRSAVGAGFGILIAKWPLLREYLDPTTQAALATAASGIVVGVWSHVSRSIEQKQHQDAVKTAAVTGQSRPLS